MLARGKTDFLQSLFQQFPGRLPHFAGTTLVAGAEKDMPVNGADADLGGDGL
jgi:hypothetical protein